MSFLPRWKSRGSSHPATNLFTLARPLLPDVPTGGRVLEVGCGAGDWMALAHLADPALAFIGVDWKPGNKPRTRPGVTVIEGDVLAQPFAPASFDACVALSAIEHIGLGHYHADPKVEDGDAQAMRLMRTWTRPGGWIYLDVPYTPEGFFVLRGSKCRCYDDAALAARFGPHRVLGYTSLAGTDWIDRPTRNRPQADRPYWYVALLIGV